MYTGLTGSFLKYIRKTNNVDISNFDVNTFVVSHYFESVVLPLIRNVFPALVANQVVSVQPMTGPTGIGYALGASYSRQVTKKRKK